jgi:hypothetical protein
MLVGGVVSKIVHYHFQQAALLGSLHDGMVERRLEQVGDYGDYVYAEGQGVRLLR